MLSAAFKIQYSNNIKGKNSMQTPRLPKYLMLSSFALLTATTSLIFNDHEIKADTAENTAATAVSTTVSNTVVLNSTAQTDIASSAVADNTASLSDSASSAVGEQRASSSADVLTEVTTPDTGNVTQSDASWTLKGLGNYTFAQVDYYNSNQTAQPAGQLSINASGQPHSYFPNAQYARITVSRGSETLFDQTFIGDQNYRFKQTLQLQAGDILSIEHAEAKTRYTTNNDATMKTSALGDLSRFVFVVANNLSLKNISDYAYLDVKTKQLIDNGALAFGASASDVATLQNQLDNQQADLTTEQRALLQTRLDQAKALLANTTNSINVGQTMTYQGFVLSPDASIMQTNKEGRYMGTYHDRQSLGMVLSDGATLKIRRIDNGYSGSVSIQLIGDSSKKIVTQSVGTDWVEITANGDDAAVFLRTPENAQTTGPLLEYELVSGTAKELPVFTADSDQAAVLKQWDQSKAAFALMDANNIEILIPYQDIKTVKNTDMNSLIDQYDNQVFKLYDELTGIPTNTVRDQPVKGRYFAFADQDGIGAAYWSVNYTAANSSSIASYLTINWLPLHEIGHGYEVPASDMYIIDSFNNIYGTLYQSQFNSNFTTGSWIFGTSKDSIVQSVVDSVLTKKQSWADLGYRERLVLWMNLAYNLEGTDAFKYFNIDHRANAVAGKTVNQIGKDWISVYAQHYKLNVTPFFATMGVSVDDVTALNSLNYPAVAMLTQVVPDDQLTTVMQKLGWDQDFLKSKVALITNEQLAQTGLTSHIILNLSNADKLIGSSIKLMNGTQTIATIPVTSNTVDLGTLANGIYTLTTDNPNVKLTDQYLYVKEDATVNETVTSSSQILPSIASLFTDDTYQKLADTATVELINNARSMLDDLQNETIKNANEQLLERADGLIGQWEFNGYGGSFASYRYLNNDGTLLATFTNRQPNTNYGANTYVTVTVTDANGNQTYQKIFYGNVAETAGTTAIKLNAGDILTFDTHDGMQLVAPESLKGSNSRKFVYEVTKNLHLRLAGTNSQPIITAPATVTIKQGSTFDPLADVTATDADDGTITLTAANVAGTVDVNTPGTYFITHTVTDSDGAISEPVTTIVTVEAVKTQITINYVADDQNETQVASQTLTGDMSTTQSYTISIPENYELVGSDLPADGLLTFNKQPTTYTVHLKTAVKASDTPADPGSNTPSDSGSQSAALPGDTPADSSNSAADKPSVPDSSSSADTPADSSSDTPSDSGSQSAALPGDTPADSSNSAADKPSVPDSSSSADTPADSSSDTPSDSGSQSAALPGDTPADSNGSAADKPSVPDFSSSVADTPADPGSDTPSDSGSQSAALPGDTPADSNNSAADKPSVPDSGSSVADTPSPLVIADNSTNPTVAIDQTSAASTSNRPANQATANQQLPQTGNKNSALLGLGLSALAAMLGIGGKRLKRD